MGESSTNNADSTVGEAGVPDYYLPPDMQFISWDFPNICHTGIDIDYKLTGYDYYDRELSWSIVEGPEGMSIDSDGTLHWTPESEQITTVTVNLLFDGTDQVSKQFNISVDDSKCIFISPDGNDETGDGSRDMPYALFEEAAAEAIYNMEGGCTVYLRGGEYTGYMSWFDSDNYPYMRQLNLLDLEENDPVTIRNYPDEEPIYNLTGTGFRLYNDFWIFYGLEISGGTGSEAGGLCLGGKSAAKKMYVHDYDQSYTNNPTGVRISGDAVLDQVIAGDNYDRDYPTHHNSSNFLFYGTGESLTGNAYFIDCLSLGYSSVGFKIKHAGDETRLHIHKCADVGTLMSWGGAQNQTTIRNSYFIASESSEKTAVSLSVTDPTTDGEVNLDEGMLIENNLIIQPSSEGKATAQASWTFDTTPETPAYWRGNTIESYATGAGNIFCAGEWTSNTVSDSWTVVFEENTVYTTKADTALIISGETGSLDDLFAYGNDNETFSAPGSYEFEVAGVAISVDGGAASY
ncbi:MAG: hypothetical protein PQJ59_17850 [Spirochaetales bacterium]|nr:hypothetical protein [Spirochaetales bacterium]